jgi:ubiquitin-protein ligase
MQSYQSAISIQYNVINKLSYIIDTLYKNSYIKTWKVYPDLYEIIFSYNGTNYTFKLYVEKNKPSYIFSEINNLSNFENQLCNKINSINLEIDNYERIEDVLYDIVYNFTNIANTNISKKTEIEIPQKKVIDEFINQIEFHKKSIKKNTIISKVLSSDSVIEMLGDQLIKIQSNNNYSVDLKDLQNFVIKLSNFSLANQTDSTVSDLSILITIKLSNDIIGHPPVISLKSNYILKNNILKVIEKLKPFTDNTKWSIKYSIYDTVENIYQMICKYGELDSMAKSELDSFLTELEYLLSIKSENISENKLLLEFDEILANELAGFINNTNNSSKNPTYWKPGTGYGHQGTSKWNIDEYATSVKLRKSKIAEKLTSLMTILDKTDKLESLDIEKLITIFNYYMLDDELDSVIVVNIANIISNNFSQFENKKSFSSVLKNVKDYLEENNINHSITQITKNIVIPTKLDDFQQIFNEYKFKYFDGDFNSFHYAKNSIVSLTSNQVSRLQKEFQILKKSISLTKDASIFFCIQKNNVNKIRFIISGPKNTPYELGLLIFDMTMGSDFPSKPPKVNFSNNGGKRFNPNLYDSGKVCLSLLGTWSGDKGESWNINTSSLNQLLISIQSQILVDEPYYNEPGHERAIGTPHGNRSSAEYNYNIRQYTLDHTMCDLLASNIYPEFQDIINKYFKFQKSNIIQVLNKWLEEMPTSRTLKFQESYDKFVNLVNKL